MKLKLLPEAASIVFPDQVIGRVWKRPLVIFRPADLSSQDEHVFQKLQAETSDKIPKKSNEITIRFRHIKPEGPETLQITAYGLALQQLHDIIYLGDKSQNLKLRLLLTISKQVAIGSRSYEEIAAFSLDMSPQDLHNHKMYAVEDNTILYLDLDRSVKHNGEVQLEIDVDDYIPCLKEGLVPTQDLNRNILETKKCCDFHIESAAGTLFPCHKVFLSLCSSVLSNTIEGDFKEGKEGKMVMNEMTDESVGAFLEFVYCSSFMKAVLSCQVAFELMKAADFYDMENLWNLTTKILTYKSSAWYTVPVALHLFDFVAKKLEKKGCHELRKKLIKVLSSKLPELDSCKVFQEIFPTSTSREFFKNTLLGIGD